MTTCGTTLAELTTMPAQAKAKSKMSLKAVPKKLRGTWYNYAKYNGKYSYGKTKFTAKKLIYVSGKDKQTFTIHPLKLNKAFSSKDASNLKKMYWDAAFSQRGYTVFSIWGSYRKGYNKGKHINGDGAGYKVAHKTYKGKRVKALKVWRTTPYDQNTYSYVYHTKAQAKHFPSKG